MLDKGKISSITADGDKAVVIPSYTDSAVTFPLVIPESLKGNLNVNDSVLYAMFEDNTGIIIGRTDGNDDGIVEPITYSLRTMAMAQPEPCVEIVLNCDKGNSSKACLVGDGATSVSYDEKSEKIHIFTPEIIVDSALSNTSENPVQNKVLSERFSKLVSDINDSFDAVSESLNGKAPTKHSHDISDITSLEDSLKNKGDMFKSVYDSNNDGKVDGADDASKLGGKTASEILTEFLQSDELNDYIQKHKYDIGDIYTTTNPNMNTAAKVAAKFGGTWVAWGTGRVPVGVDSSQTEFYTVEKTGGEKTHTLTVDEMPSHEHDVSGTAASGGEHTHDVSGKAADVSGHTHPVSGTALTGGSHSHGSYNSGARILSYNYSTVGVGVGERSVSAGSGNFKAPTINSASADWIGNDTTGTHSGHTHSLSGTAASAGGHGHSVSGTAASDGAHEHDVSGTAAATGGGGEHNNLQPYITCYMWKRTA